MVQSDPRGEEREDLVGSRVGDEDVEILQASKMSEGCPVLLASCTNLLCDIKFAPHDAKLVVL